MTPHLNFSGLKNCQFGNPQDIDFDPLDESENSNYGLCGLYGL